MMPDRDENRSSPLPAPTVSGLMLTRVRFSTRRDALTREEDEALEDLLRARIHRALSEPVAIVRTASDTYTVALGEPVAQRTLEQARGVKRGLERPILFAGGLRAGRATVGVLWMRDGAPRPAAPDVLTRRLEEALVQADNDPSGVSLYRPYALQLTGEG